MNFESKKKTDVDKSNVLARDLWEYLTKNYGENPEYDDPKIIVFALASIANTVSYYENYPDERYELKKSFVGMFSKMLMREFGDTKENNLRGH